MIEESSNSDFSIRDICHRVGVTHTAAYRHFTRKEEIFQTLGNQGFSKLSEVLRAARIENSENALQALKKQSEAYLKFVTENPGYYRCMFKASTKESSREPFQEMAQVIQILISEGHFKKRPLAYAVTTLLAGLHGLAQLILENYLNDLVKSNQGLTKFSKLMIENMISGLEA